jgi:lipoprotein-releasing system permease protein
MNSSFFIAKRYLFSKKTHNVINIISGISVFGIAISTLALVIVLSAFNGIEQLVTSFNSAYEQDIRIESKKTRTFDENYIPGTVYAVSGLLHHTAVVEETIIIKNEEQFIIGKLKGVENTFTEMSEMESHLEDGYPILEDETGPLGLIGLGAFVNLDGSPYAFETQLQRFTIYAPQKNQKIRSGSIEGFKPEKIPIAGVFSFNNRVDEEVLIVPIAFARDVLGYGNDVSAIELSFEPGTDLDAKKLEIQQLVGPGFSVKTHFEQNQLIYQTSKTEKWLVVLFLTFIFFMVTFTLISSITMLVIEKKNNLLTLRALGAGTKQLIRIFFFEGLLINFFGLVLGLAIGYLVCFLQQQFGLIMLDEEFGEIFPIHFKWSDLLLILSITTVLGTIVSYFPSRFLVKRIIK